MARYRPTVGSREWRAQFDRERAQFDRMFPLMLVLVAVITIGVAITIIVLTVNGTLPAWFAAWWFFS